MTKSSPCLQVGNSIKQAVLTDRQVPPCFQESWNGAVRGGATSVKASRPCLDYPKTIRSPNPYPCRIERETSLYTFNAKSRHSSHTLRSCLRRRGPFPPTPWLGNLPNTNKNESSLHLRVKLKLSAETGLAG